MKFGVREICDVVLKAKATQRVGNKVFYKGEPVIYFDTLKTSGLEGAATTVYAQGGRGNSRLMAWEGERTVTFTMEDALISPAGFMILSGAGLVEASSSQKINVHVAEQTDAVYTAGGKVYVIVDKPLSKDPGAGIYVMLMEDGEITTEPFLGKISAEETFSGATPSGSEEVLKAAQKAGKVIEIGTGTVDSYTPTDITKLTANSVVMVDYYTEKTSGAQQIEITPDKFGGNYYLEASTLFRNTAGVDMPAEFIIPNCKVQSNFNFTMASSGDPSTFTFTMDAFPDYTRFDRTKKVLAAIQIINEEGDKELVRDMTAHNPEHDDKVN